jgi:hypothetical protein
MIKVSTFLTECLNEIEMKKYLPPCELELTSFCHAQANLSTLWMAPARYPMLQQGLKCFKEKKKSKKIKIKIQKKFNRTKASTYCHGRWLDYNLGGFEMFQD